jgi:hypothetical protein
MTREQLARKIFEDDIAPNWVYYSEEEKQERVKLLADLILEYELSEELGK